MKKDYTLFYSWQSDFPSNKKLIQNALDKAKKKVSDKLNQDFQVELRVDSDAKGNPGSSELANSIFRKISKSNIFIGDVTIVNKNILSKFLKQRITPNPNVSIEVGYAISEIGWERIILLHDIDKAKTEELPFDIRGNTILAFNSKEPNVKEELINRLYESIYRIIRDYDEILKAQRNFSHKTYDNKIFTQINSICSEIELMDILDMIATNLGITEDFVNKLDKYRHFYDEYINHFIDPDLNKKFNELLSELEKFYNIFLIKFFADYNLQTGITTFKPNKNPFQSETYDQANERIIKLQEDLFSHREVVKRKYREFISECKQKSIIY